MSAHKSIPKKIDELFLAHKQDSPEDLRLFVDHLRENYTACRKTEARNFVLLLLIWLAATLVAFDAVAEAEVTAVKLKNVKLLLLLAAPAIGFVGHNLVTGYMHSVVLWQAIQRSYHHLLPKAYELDLESLAAPPSFTDLARSSLLSANGVIKEWWNPAVGIFILFLPGILMGHLAYLLYAEAFATTWIRLASVGTGVALWSHALWLAWGTVTLSEG